LPDETAGGSRRPAFEAGLDEVGEFGFVVGERLCGWWAATSLIITGSDRRVVVGAFDNRAWDFPQDRVGGCPVPDVHAGARTGLRPARRRAARASRLTAEVVA